MVAGQPFSNRVVSLTPVSVDFLKSIQVWDHVEQERVCGYKKIQVWDGLGGGELSFESPQDLEAMAYMVELNNLVCAMKARLRSAEQSRNLELDILEKTAVTSIEEADSNSSIDWPKIKIDQEERVLRARLLVGADGINSPVRKFAKIESMGWDYGQNGLVGTIKLEGVESDEMAWQRFLPTGTLALLPLKDNLASIVWSLPSDLTGPIQKLPSEQQLKLVQAGLNAAWEDLDFLLSQVKIGTLMGSDLDLSWRPKSLTTSVIPPKIVELQEGSLAAFPLRMRHVDQYIQPRIALVG